MNLKELVEKTLVTFFLSMLCVFASAQSNKVTGMVVDQSGQAVIGASVLVVGTKVGTITDLDGKFMLLSVGQNAKIKVSFIGYMSQTITVVGKNVIHVKMIEDAAKLDEVVVIGYGSVKKRDLTGAVASVNSETLVANPVSDVSQALQGHLPGVTVVAQDGRPGATVSIRVRGGGSITQSNDPLFVVDGFTVSTLSDIPADQIESIDVLKDASSTAIYGARGANGVILVTTKGAKAGKVKVTYSGYLQVKTAAKTLKVLNAQQYIYHNWAYATALGESYANGVAEYFGLGSNNHNHYDDYANVSAHNYTDDMLRTSYSNSQNLSITAGTEKTKIAFFFDYIKDPGIKINSGYDRFNATLKVQQELLKNLKLNFDIRYKEDKLLGKDYSTNGKGSLMSHAYAFRPIDNPLGTGDFSAFGNGDVNVDNTYNPVSLTNDVINQTKKQKVRGLLSLDWEIIKGLTARTELNLNRDYSEGKYYEDGLTNGYKYAKLTQGNGWGVRSATTLNYKVQGLSKDHNLSFLLGHEVMASKSNSSYMTGAGYTDSFDFDKAFGLINMTDSSLGLDTYGNTIGTPSKTLSFFSRANYSFKDRYLFTATFRADGSSKFAPDHRWGYFPAGAFAWRISDEPFMSNAQNWLSNLKLRLSWGEAGADNISSSLWKESWTSNDVTINGVSTTVFEPEGMLSNPDLKWETTTSRNLGFDFGFLNNRLSGTIDAYWNSTRNLLMEVPIDATTGYSYQYQNIGKTSNKGFELNLNADIVHTKDFSFNINVTYNYNKNNIDELADNVTTLYSSQWGSNATTPYYDYEFKVGHSVGLVRGYICDGFYKTSDFNYSNGVYKLKDGVADLTSVVGNYPSPFTLANGQIAFPGAIKLRDVDKSGKVDNSDVTDLGEITPKHTGGFNLNATYKNFDMSASFAWQIGGHVYNANAMANMYGNKDNSIGANRLSFVKDCYKVYQVNGGDIAAVTDPTALDALNTNAKYALPYYENAVVLSTFLEDASYLRLNALTLGYTLPKTLTSKISVSRCRFYLTGTNLFTLTGYSGVNPEVNANTSLNSSTYPTLGMDFGTYPRARTYTVGVNIEF